jgi:hypothetical protein
MPSSKQSRRRRRNRVVHTNSAPTMNAMQQVDTWNLLDLVPLSASQQFTTEQPVFIEVFAGVNGWGYNLTQGNSGIGTNAVSYGDATGQF